jgi:hypothetical protein
MHTFLNSLNRFIFVMEITFSITFDPSFEGELHVSRDYVTIQNLKYRHIEDIFPVHSYCILD